jgi:hypothetical protein
MNKDIDIATRKELYKNPTIQAFYRKLQEKTDSLFSFFFKTHATKTTALIVTHNLILGLAIMYLLFGDVGYLYYITLGFMVLVLASNLMFRGCPLMKLERKYLNTKEWYGAYHMLEFFGIDITNQDVKKYFILWGGMIVLIPFLRIYFRFW